MRELYIGRVIMGSVLLAAAAAQVAWAADPSPQEIIQKFAAKEAEFRKARENYTYKQSVRVEELDASGNIQGKYEMNSDIIFGSNKARTEHVTYAPMNTLKNILLTPEDE